MEIKSHYIKLEGLEVYQLAVKIGELAWEIYHPMDWQTKKIIGDQFITSSDSVGANIAEGYGRYHFLDRIKFYYNARASLVECNNNWLELLYKREFIDKEKHDKFRLISEELLHKLNIFISATYTAKDRA